VVFHVARFDRAVEAARQHIDRLKRSVAREKKPAPSRKAALDAVCAALNSAVENGGSIDLDALRSALNTRK
jgi:branched-subunit amino acid aminotransferase/4-amino-4-deoxychorismate lyase